MKRTALVTISSGAGGADSDDFVLRLLKMLGCYCASSGFTAVVRNQTERQVELTVEGDCAYEYLRAVKGVHRLSDERKGKKASILAAIDVIPLTEASAVELKRSDMRVETFRSSGAGGQYVNTTDSAVRITHIPTGLTASCQSERSQQQNLRAAADILSARIAHYNAEKAAGKTAALRGDVNNITFGTQIITYMFYPKRMAKDHRTGWESKSPDRVLGGDIQPLIDKFLEQKETQE